MAINVKDTKQMEQALKDAKKFRERLIGDKRDKDEDIVKAVKVMVGEMAVIPKDPIIIWLKDLKSSDLEPKKNGEATLADQLNGFWNSGRSLEYKVSTVSGLVNQKVYSYWSNETKAPQELLDEYRAIDSIFGIYSGRASQSVNAAKTISSRMYRLNKNAPLAPTHVTSWRDRVVNAYSRSTLPVRLVRYYKAYNLGEAVMDDERCTSTLEFIKACEKVALNLYSILFINDKLILIEKPILHLDNRNFLHNENGPAIHFPKLNAGVYCINNVRVSKQLITTPAEKLKADLITKTRNAEIRRELVRKIGIERVLSELGATVLDKTEDGKYELVSLALGDGRNRPYLKMLNPSIGTWHIEGVEPRITTVAGALRYRNGTEEAPVILT